jgi:hypothetical protein
MSEAFTPSPELVRELADTLRYLDRAYERDGVIDAINMAHVTRALAQWDAERRLATAKEVAAPGLRDALTKARAFIEHEREMRASAYDGPGLDEETGAAANELRAYVVAPAKLLTEIDAALMPALPPGAVPLSANERSPS